MAVLVVLWIDLRHVWLCMWFYGQTRGLCGGVGGSMDQLKTREAVLVVLWTDYEACVALYVVLWTN